jgi:hypothetical protein
VQREGYLLSPPSSRSSPRPSCGSVPICATKMITSSRNPLSCRERDRLCNVDQPLLTTPSRDGSVPACAMWAGTSSRPSHPSSSSHPMTPAGRLIRQENLHRSRAATRQPHHDPPLLRIAQRLASRSLRFPHRPMTCVTPYVPRPTPRLVSCTAPPVKSLSPATLQSTSSPHHLYNI